MKNKNLVLIISIIFFSLLVVGISGLVLYKKTSQSKRSILYELTYYDGFVPGSKSDINIYDDKVEIITTQFCSTIECDESKPEKETFNYSKENMNKLKNFINNNFSTDNNQKIELNESKLNEYQEEIIQGLLLGEYFFETNVEEFKYKIEYSKTDNLTYIIYFKGDKSILVKKLKINDDYDIVNVNTYSLNFSKENLNILNNYIEKEANNENKNIIYKSSTLKKDEISIINSMVENNESYLKDIDNEAKLSYIISYDGINCLTPTLYLYSNNTYEYYYTYSFNDEILIPKTGTYDYDVTKIIDNINKYEENIWGLYYIKDSNSNIYKTYNTNVELLELLNSLNVTLDSCLEQQ